MKRILITALYYPPCSLIGAKRPFKMATYLSKSGWDVTVLTVDPKLTPPVGELTPDVEKIKTIRTGAFLPFFTVRNIVRGAQKILERNSHTEAEEISAKRAAPDKARNPVKSLIRRSLTSMHQIDEWSGWKRSALRAMRSERGAYDVVLSTIPPHSTAYLGLKLASYYDCKFVLDYRDPWSELLRAKRARGECSTRKLERNIRIEDACLEFSDLILTVSPAITEMLRSRVDKKILTIPQGFNGVATVNGYDSCNKYLLYAGSLAYGRDLSPVFSAVRYLASKINSKLKVVYCGDDVELATEQARSVGASEFLDVRGPIGEDEVFDLAQRSVCNIVIISPGYLYPYPGKIFDLIPAGRPIYVISPGESVAGKLVEDYAIGHAADVNDIVALATKLECELSAEFKISDKVNELQVDQIYKKMLEQGLQAL